MAQGFNDDFSSPVLDPAWTVIPGGGNSFSLVERPGFLRYRLTAFTHDDGFINGFLPTVGYHSCCTHVSGLELHRMFGGENWTFETRVEYFMPFANGRRLGPRVYFGTGGPGTFYAAFERQRDVHPFNQIVIRLMHKHGPTLNDQTMLEQFLLDLGGFGPPESTHYFRLDRAGGVLTAMHSHDGLSWTTAWSHDLGTQLDLLPQRVVLPGLSWAVPAGSYIDYDYVRVTEACPTGDGDRDDDGMDDESETLFGNLLNDADSDDDGIRDGNDDGDDDGEDDEDEDDSSDPCPEDGDEDGEDDEDEDDEEDDD